MEQKIPEKVIQISSFIFRAILVSGLLIVFNLPLAFSLAFIPMSQENIMIFVIQLITLFPSLVAMNYALWNPVDMLHETMIIKRFWTSYKANFKKSWLYSLAFTALIGIFTFDYLYVSHMYNLQVLKYLCILLLFAVWLVMLFSSVLLSRYDLSFKTLILDCAYLLTHKLFQGIILGLSIGAIFLITKSTNWPILQLFMWGISGYLLHVQGKKYLETMVTTEN